MASFTGMDIDRVRQLAAALKSKAEEIRGIQNYLTGQLNDAPWMGADRERFLGEWTSQHCTALNNVIQGLEAASQTATMNAAQQESASNA